MILDKLIAINDNATKLTLLINEISNSTLITATFKNSQQYAPSRLGTALGAIVAFAFILIGLIGDILITISILYKKELRNNLVNIFIVSLQINDIFNIGFNQFFVGLAYANMGWTGPLVICEVVVYTSIIITSVQLWHHALIAIHRYLVVVCNQTTYYMGMSPKIYVLSSLIIARLIPTLVCSPAFLKKMTEYSPSALRCMLAPGRSGFQNLLIVIINMLIPCSIVVFCFMRIFARVHKVSKNIRHGLSKVSLANESQLHRSMNQLTLSVNEKKYSSTSLGDTANQVNGGVSSGGGSFTTISSSLTASMRREIQITKMFTILFTVFLFGYLPYGIIRLIDKSNSLHPDYYILLTVLFIISISVSPIIYGLMNTQIRTQCVQLLHLLFQACSKDNDKKRRTSSQMVTNNNERRNSFRRMSTKLQVPGLNGKPIIIQNDDESLRQPLNENSIQNKVRFDLTNTTTNSVIVNDVKFTAIEDQNGEELDGGMYKNDVSSH